MTDLRERFERDLADLQPPPGFEGAVLGRGRRLRTRRRAGQVTGGLLAAAACTAIVVTTVGGSTGTADPGYADDPTPSVAPSPTPSQEQAPQTDQPPGWWDTSSRRMLTVLKTVLPDGVTVTASERFLEGTTERTMAIGTLHGVLAGPTGPGAFQVILYPPDPSTAASEGSSPGVPGEDATQFAESAPVSERIRCQPYLGDCEPLLDAAGATIGRVSTNEESGTTYHEVMLLGPGGGALYFYVGDSSGEKPGYEPPSAEAPPLSPEQLVALAQDPVWTDYEPED